MEDGPGNFQWEPERWSSDELWEGEWEDRPLNDDTISEAEMIVVHFTNEETGLDAYFTLHGPFADDWEDFLDYMDAWIGDADDAAYFQ